MARNDDNNSIVGDRWWLNDEVAFVAESARTSESSALEYLLDRLHRNEIDWSFDKLEFDFLGSSPPESDYIRIGQLFFRRHISVQPHKIDLISNRAERTGAAILGIRLDDKGTPQPIWNSRYSLTMRATMIRLYHPHVVRALQRSRLLFQPTIVPASPAPEPDGPSAPQSAPEQTNPTAPTQEPKQWKKPEDAMRWLADRMNKCPIPNERRQKTAWARESYKKMEKDFGPNIPWGSADVLRRRADDILKDGRESMMRKKPGNQPGKKV
jgi:hypothetical protein